MPPHGYTPAMKQINRTWMKLGCGIGLAVALSACGIAEDEHLKALADQKGAYDAEMKKMQASRDEKEKEVAAKQQMIEGLEAEVQTLGGNLENVRSKMGAQATELASAKSDLAASEKEILQLRKLREQAEAEAAQFKLLVVQFKSMIDAGKLEVVMRDGHIQLKLPDDVLFPSGSKNLKPEGMKALEEVASVLKDVPGRKFMIAGHTDNVPLKKGARFKNNWELSTARAVEVVQFMVQHEVKPETLAATGFGPYDPIADNSTSEGRAKNRRLEIILLPQLTNLEF
jgi:chemotaxis protein MotB